jgi:hypothetical protein
MCFGRHLKNGRHSHNFAQFRTTFAAIMVTILAAIFQYGRQKFQSAPMLQLQRTLIFRGF